MFLSLLSVVLLRTLINFRQQMWSAVFNEQRAPVIHRRTATPHRSYRSQRSADEQQEVAVYNAPPLRTVIPQQSNVRQQQSHSDSSFMTQVSKTTRPTTHQAARTSLRAPPNYHHYRSVKHPRHYHITGGLLPNKRANHQHRHLLLLDLDETMVHASVNNVPHDVSFLVDMTTHQVPIFVKLRPYLFHFLQAVTHLFEVAVFTASLDKYADKVLDYLDPQKKVFTHRLFRDQCTEVDGSYVKDLSILGRPLENIVIVDNSPAAYLFHPQNAMAISSWFDDPNDTELLKALPYLESIARSDSVFDTLAEYNI